MRWTTCRISGEPLTSVIDLGELHVSDFLSEVDDRAPKARLELGLADGSGLLQLMETRHPDDLYREYWYRSGVNSTMRHELADVVRFARLWAPLEPGDVVLDIGCNDGTLLAQYPKEPSIVRVGIDPAENLAASAEKDCDLHACAYFDLTTFLDLSDGRKARVITSVAMFYDLDEPHGFVRDIARCLTDGGVWILQLSYTPLMIEQNAFDNICHEHVAYYTLLSLSHLVGQHGLSIVDAEVNDSNGGSLRLAITNSARALSMVPTFRVELGRYRYDSLITLERHRGYASPERYESFMCRVDALREKTVTLLEGLRRRGKRVCGYGASTKGNTLLQYYGLTTKHLDMIAERQPEKYGLLTVGSWIPIVSETEMRRSKPDFLFVLPWHFTNAFLEREREFRARGGRFIVPLPELQVL